jgi:2'-5' RNA ligase
MSNISDVQQWGLFALVSYVPDPLGSFLSELRRSLPGDENPQPHITILPPRPLLLPAETAWLEAKDKLQGRLQFEVELGEVRLFAETNILYLALSDGSSELRDLHTLLNADSLYHDERFEYSPHLTLSGPGNGRTESEHSRAQHDWRASGLARRFTIADIVFLWQSAETRDKQWQRLWTYRLAEPPRKAAGA